MRAVDYGLRPVDYVADATVDFPALRARAHISACWRMLWITHLAVLWITHLAVLWITWLTPLWITWLTPLWITWLTPLWITRAVLAVDFPALRARAQEMRGDSNQARGRQAVF